MLSDYICNSSTKNITYWNSMEASILKSTIFNKVHFEMRMLRDLGRFDIFPGDQEASNYGGLHTFQKWAIPNLSV